MSYDREGQRITIDPVHQSDRATFTCVAQNEAGRDQHNYDLEIMSEGP